MKEKYTGIDTFSVENIPLYIEAAKNGCVIAFDTETTGFHNHDDIVELGWVIMENGEVHRADFTYVKNMSVPLNGTEAQQVNGLTDEFLNVQGRHPEEVYTKFCRLLESFCHRYNSIVLVAHNLPFDLRMMQSNMERYGTHTLAEVAREDNIIGCDTRDFVKVLNLPKDVLPDNTLENCTSVFALDAANTHRAIDDTMACMELFRFLTKED